MKAYLLAAGLGTRLRPLTETTPKCLIPVAGRPLLSWWLEHLEREGVTHLLINLHHLPDVVRAFISSYAGPIDVTLAMEEELLGSAGTLHRNRSFVEGDEQFYLLYGDNLTDVALEPLRMFNARHPAPLTVGLFHAENPSACGIAERDPESGIITDFVEKPAHPRGDLASAGIFVARQELFDHLTPTSYPYDLGHDVMPRLIGIMNGIVVDGYLQDVGTPENLARGEREWIERNRPGTEGRATDSPNDRV